MSHPINCAEACINGCILGAECPHLAYREAASKFIQETSIERILEIAEAGVRKKFSQSPERYLPNPPSWEG